MKTDKNLLHIGAIIIFAACVFKNLNDNSCKAAVDIDFFQTLLIIIIIIIEYSFFLLVSKLANYFGKGSKY
jgi:hypothetical protein